VTAYRRTRVENAVSQLVRRPDARGRRCGASVGSASPASATEASRGPTEHDAAEDTGGSADEKCCPAYGLNAVVPSTGWVVLTSLA
jgi:hypothetical protein